MNVYNIDTLVKFSVTFTDPVTGAPINPPYVYFYTLSPSGVQGTVTTPIIGGGGVYFWTFVPTEVGIWTYKWQAEGSGVNVTTIDTRFLVRPTEITWLNPP